MYPIFHEINKNGLIPTVYAASASEALAAAKALTAGGIWCAEFCGAGAESGIKAVKEQIEGFIAGASYIRTEEQADALYAAGADYLATAGYNDALIDYCAAKDYPLLPGVATVGELEKAAAHGYDVVKVFPIAALGGVAFVKALGEMYGNIKLVCDGGICPCETDDYVECYNVFACVPDGVAAAELIRAGKFDEITANAKEAVKSMLDFKLFHVGVNMSDAKSAKEVVDTFIDTFHLGFRESPAAYFGDNAVEIMKTPGKGAMGHIGFWTASVDKAITYLQRKGFTMNVQGRGINPLGQSVICYMEEEIGGFGIHVSKR